MKPLTWRQSFASDLGWLAWQGTNRGVTHLTLAHPHPHAAEQDLPGNCEMSHEPDWLHSARQLLLDYCAGENVDLTVIPRDLPESTPFQQQVIRALLTVGWGSTVSYAQLAELAGSPRAARAVGTVMSTNPLPLLVPCHRVVATGGRLGGYSAAQGVEMKRQLLAMERSVTSPVS